jgi:hypothetical protein
LPSVDLWSGVSPIQAVDRPIKYTRRNDPVMAQGGKEGHRLPMAMRDAGGKPFAL